MNLLAGDEQTHEVVRIQDVLGTLATIEEKHAPDVLYASGDVSLLTEGSRISIIGSRKASRHGMERTRIVVQALVEQGMVVVSGLAEGIDTVAHQAAMKAGGKTIAVLGTPLSQVYPARNADLLAEIKQCHLAVSQFPEGYPFHVRNFPLRNRTMALISDATIIIEADEKSGTRYQGWEAIRLGRHLYLLENIAQNPDLTWPKEMLSYGAQVLQRSDLPEILLEIPNFTQGGDCVF